MNREVIRKIALGELSLVKKMEQRCFESNCFNEKEIEEMYINDRYKFIGIWSNGSLAGYLIMTDSIDVYEIIKVGVDDEYRGRGLGKLLIEKAFETIKVDLMLEVRENNESAIRLYKKIGFKKIGLRKGYYGDTGEDALILVLGKQC